MPINRIAQQPFLYEYLARKALIPNYSTTGASLLPLGIHEWVQIPNFQRGISWDVDKVEEFLQASSEVLGNVILGQFNRVPSMFPLLPSVTTRYLILVDGLQRFSVGTALLSLLYDYVLTPTGARYPTHVPNFVRLATLVNSHIAVIKHNDLELLNHPRKAISSQYEKLRKSLDEYIITKFAGPTSATFAIDVVATFLDKQVMIDVYDGFSSLSSVMSTFLGINTIRVDLGPIDLIRSYIIDKGTAWTPLQVEAVENNITSTFTLKDKENTELAPFARSVLRTIINPVNKGHEIFPSWSGTLVQPEVDNFLDFVSLFITYTNNNYFEEISECGNVPLAIIISYYYKKYLRTGHRPSFLSGGTAEDQELHNFLIACYRRILDGSIGRIRSYADQILDGTERSNLSDIADKISSDVLNKKVSQALDRDWLVNSLNKVNRSKAKRIFNAMLLPLKSSMGGTFNSIKYGNKSYEYNIDHLIPESMLLDNQPGINEGQTIRNFAPLLSNNNVVAKATSCSIKLGASGVYSTYLASVPAVVHPYCQWLVSIHAPSIATATDLDNQALLESHRTPDIGKQRIEHIADYLLQRI